MLGSPVQVRAVAPLLLGTNAALRHSWGNVSSPDLTSTLPLRRAVPSGGISFALIASLRAPSLPLWTGPTWSAEVAVGVKSNVVRKVEQRAHRVRAGRPVQVLRRRRQRRLRTDRLAAMDALGIAPFSVVSFLPGFLQQPSCGSPRDDRKAESRQRLWAR